MDEGGGEEWRSSSSAAEEGRRRQPSKKKPERKRGNPPSLPPGFSFTSSNPHQPASEPRNPFSFPTFWWGHHLLSPPPPVLSGRLTNQASSSSSSPHSGRKGENRDRSSVAVVDHRPPFFYPLRPLPNRASVLTTEIGPSSSSSSVSFPSHTSVNRRRPRTFFIQYLPPNS